MIGLNFQESNAFFSGHVACPGCVEALSMRVILNQVGPNAVAVVPPSCTAVICGPHPNSSIDLPVQHTALECSAASATGLRRALDAQGKTDTLVLVLAGDGGTYDIGFQALSSAVERNEDMLYVCFDNEGYMNTGGQKSSSTPLYAATGSTPAGKLSNKKNIIEILAAHEIPYAATASPGYLEDLARKVEKARSIKGMRFILVSVPCLPGWGLADDQGVTTARLAVETGIFPLYEVENGVNYILNHKTRTRRVEEFLASQTRFRHLSAEAVDEIQGLVDANWERLLNRVAQGTAA